MLLEAPQRRQVFVDGSAAEQTAAEPLHNKYTSPTAHAAFLGRSLSHYRIKRAACG